MGATKVTPIEVTTDKAPVYPAVPEELLPAAWHRTDRYANNRVECDHGRLKARLRPMRGLKQDRSQGDHGWARRRAEPATRPLGPRERGASKPAGGGRVRRTRVGHLIPGLIVRRHHVACRSDAIPLMKQLDHAAMANRSTFLSPAVCPRSLAVKMHQMSTSLSDQSVWRGSVVRPPQVHRSGRSAWRREAGTAPRWGTARGTSWPLACSGTGPPRRR